MADLLDLSARIIDSGLVDQPVNRVTNELSEIADGVAMVESFSHCVALQTGESEEDRVERVVPEQAIEEHEEAAEVLVEAQRLAVDAGEPLVVAEVA